MFLVTFKKIQNCDIIKITKLSYSFNYFVDGLLIEPEIANSPKRKLARGAGHQNITDDSSIGMKPSTPTDGLLSADMADRLCASQPALGELFYNSSPINILSKGTT